MFDTPHGEEREDARLLSTRSKQYHSRAAEHVTLAKSAMIQEARNFHQEVAQHYLQLAESDDHFLATNAIFRQHNTDSIEQEGWHMRSTITKRSIILAGHKTSISLEEPFWNALKDIAGRRKQTMTVLITSIDAERTSANLSSAARLFVLSHYQERSATWSGREMSDQTA
jgi:predicted DNA-binding ribbon-helix-helix protein